jgi:hypothetical protein
MIGSDDARLISALSFPPSSPSIDLVLNMTLEDLPTLLSSLSRLHMTWTKTQFKVTFDKLTSAD